MSTVWASSVACSITAAAATAHWPLPQLINTRLLPPSYREIALSFTVHTTLAQAAIDSASPSSSSLFFSGAHNNKKRAAATTFSQEIDPKRFYRSMERWFDDSACAFQRATQPNDDSPLIWISDQVESDSVLLVSGWKQWLHRQEAVTGPSGGDRWADFNCQKRRFKRKERDVDSGSLMWCAVHFLLFPLSGGVCRFFFFAPRPCPCKRTRGPGEKKKKRRIERAINEVDVGWRCCFLGALFLSFFFVCVCVCALLFFRSTYL